MLSENMTLDICSIHYKRLLNINHVRTYGKLKNEKTIYWSSGELPCGRSSTGRLESVIWLISP